ncbi:hypothetical protein KJ688_12715 [bacterium]|nr:hypothetical protein [bacterium]
MKTLCLYFITVLLLIFLLGCDCDNITESNNDLAKVNIDLQYGFDDYFVIVRFDDESYFSADLTGVVPFSGPLASFVTYLSSGEHTCKVFWREDYGQIGQPYNIDSTKIVIGDLEEYFLGIRAYNDTISVELRDTSFGYF